MSKTQMIPSKTICPCCLRQFEGHTIWKDWPICGDCDSEGMGIDVVPYVEFLRKSTLDGLHHRMAFYADSDDILPSYRELMMKRIEELMVEKAVLEAGPPEQV